MSRLSQLFSRRRRYNDLSVSIQEHIAERADELIAEGMPRTQAEQAARREFGNMGLVEQKSREAWQWPALESIFADVRFAIRQLFKSPGFTVTAVLTLALGIAVNATMFSMVSAFLLPRLPGRDPQKMVVVSAVNPDGGMPPDTAPVSVPNYLAWRDDARVFASLAAADANRLGSLSGQGQTPESLGYAAVSPDYFSVFGAAPALGRDFLANEDQAGHDHVLILGHGIWERRFGSDPTIVGRTVRFNREDYVVVGVMPASFRLLGYSPDLWTPLTLTAADRRPGARNNRFLTVFGRLRARTYARASARRDDRARPTGAAKLS